MPSSIYIEFVKIPDNPVSVGKWLDFIVYLPTGETGVQNVIIHKIIKPEQILQAELNSIEDKDKMLKYFPYSLKTIYPSIEGNKSLNIVSLIYKDFTIIKGTPNFLEGVWINSETHEIIPSCNIIGWFN